MQMLPKSPIRLNVKDWKTNERCWTHSKVCKVWLATRASAMATAPLFPAETPCRLNKQHTMKHVRSQHYAHFRLRKIWTLMLFMDTNHRVRRDLLIFRASARKMTPSFPTAFSCRLQPNMKRNKIFKHRQLWGTTSYLFSIIKQQIRPSFFSY